MKRLVKEFESAVKKHENYDKSARQDFKDFYRLARRLKGLLEKAYRIEKKQKGTK